LGNKPGIDEALQFAGVGVKIGCHRRQPGIDDGAVDESEASGEDRRRNHEPEMISRSGRLSRPRGSSVTVELKGRAHARLYGERQPL
jgi:hypothetical protein